MPPIVAIIGKSKSGKTTLIEKLISELKSRKYRVATVKHAYDKLSLDKPGKDSWRHIQAGSDATVVTSSNLTVLIKPATQDIDLDEIVSLLGEDYDIILAEGFKQSSVSKIEVHRREIGAPLSAIEGRVAIATDEPLKIEDKQFSLQDITGIADFLEGEFIKLQK